MDNTVLCEHLANEMCDLDLDSALEEKGLNPNFILSLLELPQDVFQLFVEDTGGDNNNVGNHSQPIEVPANNTNSGTLDFGEGTSAQSSLSGTGNSLPSLSSSVSSSISSDMYLLSDFPSSQEVLSEVGNKDFGTDDPDRGIQFAIDAVVDEEDNSKTVIKNVTEATYPSLFDMDFQQEIRNDLSDPTLDNSISSNLEAEQEIYTYSFDHPTQVCPGPIQVQETLDPFVESMDNDKTITKLDAAPLSLPTRPSIKDHLAYTCMDGRSETSDLTTINRDAIGRPNEDDEQAPRTKSRAQKKGSRTSRSRSSKSIGSLDGSLSRLSIEPSHSEGSIGVPKMKKKRNRQPPPHNVVHFLWDLLANAKYNKKVIRWLNRKHGTFKIEDKDEITNLWAAKTLKPKVTYNNFA